MAGIRGACIKYGINKKCLQNWERENPEKKISSINQLINLKDNPTPETLDKHKTLMKLKADLDEKNSKEAVHKHRAKPLLEGKKLTKYFCSLQKVVEKNSGLTEFHVEHAQENSPPIIEVIKDKAAIEAKITSYYRNMYNYRDSDASAARLEQFMKNSPLIKKNKPRTM